MDEDKKKRLEDAGWSVGSAEDFLGVTSKLKKLIEGGPLDSEWLAAASDDDIDGAVCDGNLNLCSDYIHWHRDLLEALWEQEDKDGKT